MSTTLHEVELLRVRLPLVTPFRTARNTTAVKDALLVRVQTERRHRLGRVHRAGDAGVRRRDDRRRAARAARPPAPPRVRRRAPFDDVRGSRRGARRARVRAARRAAACRAASRWPSWLGAERALVDAGVAVGLDRRRRRRCAGLVGDVRRRRVPAGQVQDRARARRRGARARRAPRSAPTSQLAADANGSYTLDEARAAVRRDRRPRAAVRRATVRARCDRRRTRALVDDVDTPICLDETITSVAAAQRRDRPATRATSIAIKVGRLGIADAQRVHDACVRRRRRRAARAGCSRRASGAPRCSPSPRSPASRSPATAPRRSATSAPTATSPNRSCSTTGGCASRPARTRRRADPRTAGPLHDRPRAHHRRG